MILGHEEIRIKRVFGSYNRYTYIAHSNKGHAECHIYCTTEHNFKRLLEHWATQASQPFYKDLGYKYTLTLAGHAGQSMTLDEILADNKFKVKCLLTDIYTGVTYIQ